jgi:hypothetical protein
MKYARWALSCADDQIEAVLWAAGELAVGVRRGARLAPERLLGVPHRANVGVAAIRRIVFGKPLSLVELIAAIRGDAAGAWLAAPDDASSTPPSDDLRLASWARALSDDQRAALCWAIGELGYRAGSDATLAPGDCVGDPRRVQVAIAALQAAVGQGAPGTEALGAALERGEFPPEEPQRHRRPRRE